MRGLAAHTALFIAIACASLIACTEAPRSDAGPADVAPADVALHAWNCPADWVPSAVGGCGPAVILCASDGGAAPGACDAIDLHAPHAVSDADGGTGTSFYRNAANAIAGGWHDEGDPNGYPAANWYPDAGNGSRDDAWSPDAGVPTCAAGWTRLADGTCDPVLRTDCPAGSGPLPGGGCTATAASDCPATRFPDPGAVAVGATRVFVDATADASTADGTESHPFTTLAPAIVAAGADAFVLVATGTYSEPIDLTTSVHVLGVCADRVTFAGSSASPVVHASNSSTVVELAGVTLQGAGSGLVVEGGAHVTLHHSVVHDTDRYGIWVHDTGSRVDATELFLHDIQGSTVVRVGVFAYNGGTFDASRLSIVRATQNAVRSYNGGARIAVRDGAFLDTLEGAPASQGSALVIGNASLDLDRVAVRGNRLTGCLASGIATATLRDVRIDETTSTDVPLLGDLFGGVITQSATVHADRLVVSGVDGVGLGSHYGTLDVSNTVVQHVRGIGDAVDNTGYGIRSFGPMTLGGVIVRDTENVAVLASDDTSHIDGLVVEEVRPHGAEFGSAALASDLDAIVMASHVLVQHVDLVGFGVNNGATLDVRDSVVRDIRASATNVGVGCLATAGGQLHASGLVVEDTGGVAVVAHDSLTRVDVERSRLSRIHPVAARGTDVAGGILVADGASGAVATTRIDQTVLFGIGVAQSWSGQTNLAVSDTLVRGVSPGTQSGHSFGAGILVSSGTTMSVDRTVLRANAPLAIAVDGDASRLTIRDSALYDTLAGSDGYASSAMVASSSGAIDAHRLFVSHSQDTALVAVARGSITLADTLVDDVASNALGFGTGLNASGDGVIDFDRVSITRVHGAAAMATPYEDPVAPRTSGATLTGRDLYVRGVTASTLRVEYDDAGRASASGAPVAYGLHVGAMCTVDVTRAVLNETQLGLYASSGALSLTTAVIASASDGPGAYSGIAPVLGDVTFDRANGSIVMRNDLPEGSLLPTPQPACSTPGCL